MNDNYTQIPNDTPVKLIRTYCGKSGNIYFPGIYAPGTLPPKAYNNYYVVPSGPAIVSTVKENPLKESTIKNGAFDVEGLTRHPGGPGLTEEIEINTQPLDKKVVSKITKAVEAPPIEINTIGEQDLINLPTVGKVTAKKILELREASPFVDYVDLNARVALPFGKDWTAFNIKF